MTLIGNDDPLLFGFNGGPTPPLQINLEVLSKPSEIIISYLTYQ